MIKLFALKKKKKTFRELYNYKLYCEAFKCFVNHANRLKITENTLL